MAKRKKKYALATCAVSKKGKLKKCRRISRGKRRRKK